MTENVTTWHTAKLPGDVQARLLEKRAKLARLQAVPESKITVTGATLRYLLDMTDAAEALGIKPAQTAPAQP